MKLKSMKICFENYIFVWNYGMIKREQQMKLQQENQKIYPIFSDFLNFVRNELYQDVEKKKHHENLGESRIHRLELIELNLVNLVEAYDNYLMVIPLLKTLKKNKLYLFPYEIFQILNQEVFQAQIFNVLNLLWDEMISNGAPQLEAFN